MLFFVGSVKRQGEWIFLKNFFTTIFKQCTLIYIIFQIALIIHLQPDFKAYKISTWLGTVAYYMPFSFIFGKET